MIKQLHITIICLFGAVFSMAQAVHFVQGTALFPENFSTEKMSKPAENEVFEGKYIRYVQFYQLPNAGTQQVLKNKNLLLLDYVADRVFQVAVPADFDWNSLSDFGIRSIVKPNPEWRMHKNLMERPIGKWAVHGNKIGVAVQVQPIVSIDSAASLFKKRGITIQQKGTQNGFLLIYVKPEIVPHLATLPWINWLELESQPGEPEDLKGRALLRAGALDSDHPLGKKFNGTGVSILVRDDGFIGPHIDLQARVTNEPGISADPSKTHGDRVAGTLAGVGNLDPAMRGIVPGAHVFVSDYTAGFQDGTLPLLFSDHVTITNSSYSNGCNDGYTLAAQTVDKQLFEHTNYMHVFSAGNSNGIDCDYGAGGEWGNITGGNKMAKNALVVGNIDINGIIANTSSRGPATDGRLKPDLMGFGGEQYATGPNNTYQGFSGTSAASPGVAGCFAQLTHAWKTMHGTEDAPAALLKAVMLNTCTDLGHPGPDFKYGWGQANNRRALKTLEEGRIDSNYVLSDVARVFKVNIPAGIRQANIMMYWADPQGALNAPRALVNDLDFRVIAPDGTQYQPWKLNPSPDPAILDTPAGKGRDSLNNVEQVTLVNPAAGDYNLFVFSLDIPTDYQFFYVTWDFLDDSIRITQPAGGESLAVGAFEWITWDAFGNEGEFTLEYSTNGGANYNFITTVQGNVRFYGWIVPQAVSGNVKIRISRNEQVAITDLPVTIAPQPINFAIDKVCPQSVSLKWFNADNTVPVEIFKLGEKYMEPAGIAPAGSTSFTVPVQDVSVSQWFSARYANNSGLTGRRVVAVNSAGGLINCQQTNDLTALAIISPDGSDIFSCSSLSVPVTVSVANHGTVSIGNATISYQNNNNPAVVENLPFIQAGGAFDYTFNTPLPLDPNVVNNLMVTVNLGSEQYPQDNSISTSFAVTAGISDADYLQGFENTPQIPSTWKITNPDGAFTWAATLNPVTGIDGNPTNAVYVNHFSYNPGTGQEDILSLPPTAITSADTLQFDYSHAIYSAAYVEKLRVEIVDACNPGTPVVLWEKSDPGLALDQTDVAFFPDAPEDWARVEIPLAAFAGQNAVIRFITTNDYGNNTFLDNIGFKNLPPMLGETLAVPDTLCSGLPVSISANPNPAQTIDYQWSFGLSTQPPTATGPGPVSVIFTTPGDQVIQLIGINPNGSDTLTKTVFAKPAPSADFDFLLNGLTVQLTNNSVNATSWLWDFGDGTTSAAFSPSHTYAVHGNYSVTLTATGECGTVSYAQNFSTSLTVEQIGLLGFSVSPNPGSGLFNATVISPMPQQLQVSLLDNSGRVLRQQSFDIQQGTSYLPFDCSNFPAGNYLLRVETQQGRFSVGVVIVR